MVKEIRRALWFGLALYLSLHAVDLTESYILIRLHEAQLYERNIRLLESRYDMEFPPIEEDKST